jgi:glycerol kinase
MITGNTPRRAPEQGLLPTVAWQIAGKKPVYALDGGVYTVSAALNWAKSLGLFSDFFEINAFDGPAAIEQNFAFVPALSGLGCPHWDARARGVWLGLSIDHGPRDMVQSILEGIAFRAAQTIAAMQAIAPQTGPVPIDGGMSANPYFVQFLADVLGRRVQRAAMPEMTGFGTALLAGQGIGFKFPNSENFHICQPKNHLKGAAQRFEAACEISRQWKLPNR